MSKQEEIREGIAGIIKIFEEKSPDAGYGYESDEMATVIQKWLSLIGCVIKVERELPTYPCECCRYEDSKADDDFCFIREDCGDDYKKWELAGYVAVEPLVKE